LEAGRAFGISSPISSAGTSTMNRYMHSGQSILRPMSLGAVIVDLAISTPLRHVLDLTQDYLVIFFDCPVKVQRKSARPRSTHKPDASIPLGAIHLTKMKACRLSQFPT
jgi:hypothetical protein